MTEKTCVCCGFTSDNYRLFKRANRESRGWNRADDEFICRSYYKCVERGKDTEKGKEVQHYIDQILGKSTNCTHPFRHTRYGSEDPKDNNTTCIVCRAKL